MRGCIATWDKAYIDGCGYAVWASLRPMTWAIPLSTWDSSIRSDNHQDQGNLSDDLCHLPPWHCVWKVFTINRSSVRQETAWIRNHWIVLNSSKGATGTPQSCITAQGNEWNAKGWPGLNETVHMKRNSSFRMSARFDRRCNCMMQGRKNFTKSTLILKQRQYLEILLHICRWKSTTCIGYVYFRQWFGETESQYGWCFYQPEIWSIWKMPVTGLPKRWLSNIIGHWWTTCLYSIIRRRIMDTIPSVMSAERAVRGQIAAETAL